MRRLCDVIFSQVVKNGHRRGHVARHTCCVGDTWFVSLSEKDMENSLGKYYRMGGVFGLLNCLDYRS